MRSSLQTLLALAAAGTFALGTAAQPCYAENGGPAFADGVSMGGPNLLIAIKFRVPNTLTVKYVDIFTGEKTGASSIAVWSHDPGSNQPMTQLGGGTWNMELPNGFQGACLDTPVTMSPNQIYWIVWGMPSGAQAAVDVPMGSPGQEYRGSFNGGTTWNGPFQFNNRHWKFRLHCNSAPGMTMLEGTGCAGSTGAVPNLSYAGTPTIGSALSVNLDSATPGTNAFAVVGLSKTVYGSLPLPFDFGTLGAPGCFLLCSAEGSIPATVGSGGTATASIPIPSTPSLVCAKFCNQWLIFDAGANALGLAVSQCGTVQIGG